jgi:DNA-binding CsgD family transcriptional regulator
MSSTGRPCTVCSLPTSKLLGLERAVHGGTLKVSQLARIHAVSVDSIYRHLRSHPPLEARSSTPESEDLPVAAEIIERLVESADDLRRARHVAAVNNNILSLTRAADSELRIITTLIDKLGITNIEIADDLRITEALVRAVASLTRQQPEIGKRVAIELRKAGMAEIARSFDTFAGFAEDRMKEHEALS